MHTYEYIHTYTHTQAGWGVFKILSLGGIGLWSLIDVILVGVGYLTPADGSTFSDLWSDTVF